MDMVSNWKMKKFWKWIVVMVVQGRPRWLSGKESTCQAGDTVWILDQEDTLEEVKATHSSILAWEIPWTEETGRLWSMGLQKSQTQLGDYTRMTVPHSECP